MNTQLNDALKPCPFCNMQPPDDLSDTLYPTGTYWRELNEEGLEGLRHYFGRGQAKEGDGQCWTMHCTTNMGGCGAQISGDTREQAIAAWNTRANTQDSAAQGAMGDAQIYERFIDWSRTAPMMKDNDHPMPICFIAGYKAALAAQPSDATAQPRVDLTERPPIEKSIVDSVKHLTQRSGYSNIQGAQIALSCLEDLQDESVSYHVATLGSYLAGQCALANTPQQGLSSQPAVMQAVTDQQIIDAMVTEAEVHGLSVSQETNDLIEELVIKTVRSILTTVQVDGECKP